ncbi:restriction endonuclease subunit S [Thalassotalea sp. G20_0]|uniref:restriction endonuclease subunit S n=1 Tax=Thalassotalea sp. G20_0 TaxID=2821093 RepID=UPI001ADD3D94|nr:restriction endonuclease subunit S [Thalassotalea sp. G20_0]MBO9493430.1 restriction endonuclease subunit S [Thalassotalea sp. G20_0]
MELKPGYKQTEVGVIPVDWEVVELSQAADFLDSQRKPIKSSERAKMRGAFPYYGASGVVDYVNNFIFDGEFILLGEDGENILSRNVPLAFRVSGKIWVNNHAHVLQPRESFDIDYLTAFLESLDYKDHNKGTAQPKLNKQTCLKLKIAKPPAIEQEAIAKALSDMDALIQSLEQQIIKKQQIKQGAMQLLLNPYDAHGQLKQGWSIRKLGECVNIDPENLPSNTPPDYEFKYISLENAKNGVLQGYSTEHFEKASPRARRVLKNGDVLIGTVRPNLKSHCIFTETTADWICSTGFAVIRCPKDLVSPYFVFASFFAPFIDRQIENLITGSNYPAISSGDVRALKFAAPEYKQQLQIEDALSKQDSELAALKAKLEKLTVLKQGMMQNLLTGAVRLV